MLGLTTAMGSQVLLLILVGITTVYFARENRLMREGKKSKPLQGQPGFYYTLWEFHSIIHRRNCVHQTMLWLTNVQWQTQRSKLSRGCNSWAGSLRTFSSSSDRFDIERWKLATFSPVPNDLCLQSKFYLEKLFLAQETRLIIPCTLGGMQRSGER